MGTLKDELNSTISKDDFYSNKNEITEVFGPDDNVWNDYIGGKTKFVPLQKILFRINFSLRYMRVKNIKAPLDSNIIDMMTGFIESIENMDLQKALDFAKQLASTHLGEEGKNFLNGFLVGSYYFDTLFQTDNKTLKNFNNVLRQELIESEELMLLTDIKDNEITYHGNCSYNVKQFLEYLLFDDDDYELYFNIDRLILEKGLSGYYLCFGLLKSLKCLITKN